MCQHLYQHIMWVFAWFGAHFFKKIKTSLSQTYAAAFDSCTQWTNVLDKAIVWAHSGTAHMDKEQQAGWADGVWDLLFWKPHRHTDMVAVSFIFTAAHSDSSLFLGPWYSWQLHPRNKRKKKGISVYTILSAGGCEGVCRLLCHMLFCFTAKFCFFFFL